MKNNFRRAFLPLFIGMFLFFTSASAQGTKCDANDDDCQIAAQTKNIQADPANKEAYYNRALAYKHKSQWALALRDLDKYLTFSITDKVYLADGYRERAWIRHKLNDNRGAFADITKAIEVNPDEHEAYYTRGQIYRNQKDYLHAIADFSAYIGLNAAKAEYLADGYYERGFAYNATGEFAKALKDLDIAIGYDNTKDFYYTERAYAYRKLGKIALADADTAKAAELKKP
jgi:tetratricopeptide (TPR) repeat protein